MTTPNTVEYPGAVGTAYGVAEIMPDEPAKHELQVVCSWGCTTPVVTIEGYRTAEAEAKARLMAVEHLKWNHVYGEKKQ